MFDFFRTKNSRSMTSNVSPSSSRSSRRWRRRKRKQGKHYRARTVKFMDGSFGPWVSPTQLFFNASLSVFNCWGSSINDVTQFLIVFDTSSPVVTMLFSLSQNPWFPLHPKAVTSFMDGPLFKTNLFSRFLNSNKGWFDLQRKLSADPYFGAFSVVWQ